MTPSPGSRTFGRGSPTCSLRLPSLSTTSSSTKALRAPARKHHYLAANLLAIAAVVFLFDSNLYVFLTVAVEDYKDPTKSKWKVMLVVRCRIQLDLECTVIM